MVRPDIWRDLTLHVTILLVNSILFISILVHLIIDDLLKLLLSKVMLLLLEVFTFCQEITLKLLNWSLRMDIKMNVLELSKRGSVGELAFMMFEKDLTVETTLLLFIEISNIVGMLFIVTG